MIIGHLSNENREELGLDLLVQCIKVKSEDLLENTFITLTLNMMGICYSVQVPKHEADDPKNITDAWTQLIHDFGVYHMLGQSKRIQDGVRELTPEEMAIIEASPSNQKKSKKKLSLVK